MKAKIAKETPIRLAYTKYRRLMCAFCFSILMSVSLFLSPAYAASQCVQPREAGALTKGDEVPAPNVSCSNGDCTISISVGSTPVYVSRLRATEICRYDSSFYFEGGGKKDCETNLESVLFVIKIGNRSDNISINFSDRLEYTGERCFEPEIPQFDDDSTATVGIFGRFRVLLVQGIQD